MKWFAFLIVLTLACACEIVFLRGIVRGLRRHTWRYVAACPIGSAAAAVLAAVAASVANGPDWLFLVAEAPLSLIVVVFTIRGALRVRSRGVDG